MPTPGRSELMRFNAARTDALMGTNHSLRSLSVSAGHRMAPVGAFVGAEIAEPQLHHGADAATGAVNDFE